MKILRAEVVDPRREGKYENPHLAIYVDEHVNESAEPRHYDNWRLIPHGPFFAVDVYEGPGSDEWEVADIGVFNTANLRPNRLVEVEVISPDEEIDLAMDLGRARRLVRKFQPDWHYILDDVAGQHGKLRWRLVEHKLHCLECGLPATEVYHRGTYLSYCVRHRSSHNRKIQHLRVNS